MKIIIATPIIYDDKSAFNHLFKDILGAFLEDENELVRLVAVDKDDLDNKKYTYGYDDRIKHVLFKRKKSDHANIISRFIKDTWTNIREAITILKMKNVDVLFEDVSYSSYWAVRAAKIKKIKVVSMLQDVWPDNAVQSGLIGQDSFLYRFFEMFQKYVYKKSDKIICISDDMKDFIISKKVSPEKIEVIYNWGYSDDIVDIKWEDNEFVKKYALDKDKFYAVYAGNIGKMQNVEVIVNAARKLQDKEKIKFLIIGDGAKKEDIAKMAEGLDNITMLPMQPSELATHIYSAAGVNIIPLVEGGTKTALPSKTGVVLSCGRPLICTFGKDSKFISIIEKLGAAISVDANDYNSLAELIQSAAEEKNDKKSAVYKVFAEYFMRQNNIDKYISILKTVVG